MSPMLCDYCESSNYDVDTCPFRAYIDANCVSIENKINDMTNRLVETMKKRIAKYSHCFSHSREDINLQKPDSSIGSPKPEVSLYDDFESSYLVRHNLNKDMPLSNLEQESVLPISLL